MKPGDHPEFFRFPAPEGRSRESTIVLDAEGQFWHQGERVEHGKLAAAMHTWISRHPDNGRYILENGYDWTYFTVEGAPYFITSLAFAGDGILLVLSDGTEEPWDPRTTRIGERDALYAKVKKDARGGPFEARFSRHAQMALAEVLVDQGGFPAVRLHGRTVPIGSASPAQ
ncbi:MAG TPA: hypothetical protein VNO21_15785 [Polyangiaceae bacterium]|nr:hypothetical protein [Polyangiaceae bacterium]